MSRDLRKYARQTRAQLLGGLFLLVFLVGDGLIFILYGKEPALLGLICLLAALLPVLIVVVILSIMDRVVKHDHRD